MRPPPPPPPSSKARERLRPAGGVVVAGKYQLTRLLRHGGMGSVWVATHLGLDVPVAIKFMTANLASDARARFAREAKSAAQIRGANVVQILDHGIDRGLPYIVMELLDGEDLGARLHRVGRMPLVDVARILGHVGRALERAHEKGLVHRDLKPENIFLAREGDVEVPKVLDFGIAKAVHAAPEDASDGTTREGALIGTPYFMSPEQARGRLDVDHRSDLWSLGVIAFRAVVGVKPFASRSMPDVIVQICADPIPRPSMVCPDLPPSVDAFFERALARDPNLRFQSARELAAAFADLLPSQVRSGHELGYAALPAGAPVLAPAIAPVPRTHDGATPAPSWPGAQGSWPGPQGSWPGTQGSWHGTPPPMGTPPPHLGGSGSWPGHGSGVNLQHTGGTLAHGVASGSMPASPQKTPWVLLGTLAAVAAVTLTAAGLAFMQSRGGPAVTAAGDSPSAATTPAPPEAAAPEASADRPAASAAPAPDESATAAASAAAAPKKPLAPKTPAPAATSGREKRDLGY